MENGPVNPLNMLAKSDPAQVEDDFADRLASLDDALAAGETPDSGNVESPELQARLKRGLAALQKLRHRNTPRPSTLPRNGADTLSTSSRGTIPRQLGRFQIVRELGRGGFGIVLLARDPQLHRDVALKIPHSLSLNDDLLRERFRREVQAAAGLDHPHIVQLFEAEEKDSACWIAYAYCPGMALSTWLTKQSSSVPVNEAAKLIESLADAVEHAHHRGVLHRDLKPANIILQVDREHAADKLRAADFPLSAVTAKVADFGLARMIDDSTDLTRTGAVIGTPANMSPEQARGRGLVDARSDVYSLGAILYELLTGRPPFRGETDLETLQLVQNAEPIAPRRQRPKVPRDVNTVCLKCLEKDPNRRYQSAGDLRDDLRRFLAGEHVHARPIGRLTKVARWCRRRPAVTALVVALFAAITLGVAGVTRQYQLTTMERDSAIKERDRSVRLLAHAHDLVDRLHTVGEELRNETRNAAKGREILQETLGYYKKLLQESGNDPIFQNEIARVSRIAGVTYRDLGRLEEAIATYQTGLDALAVLEKHDPTVKDLAERRAELLLMQGDSMRNARMTEEAKAVLAECERLAAAPTDNRQHSPALQRTYAQVLVENAIMAKDERDYATSVTKATQAAKVFRKLVDESPDDFDLRSDLAHAIDCQGASLFLNNQLDEAVTAIQECLDLHQALWKEKPRSLRSQLGVAMSYGRLGDVAEKRGLMNDAIDWNRKAGEVYDNAATSCPQIPQVHREYAGLLKCQADLFEKEKRFDEALESLDKMVVARLRLVEIQPTSTRRRLDLAQALYYQGRMAMHCKDVAKADAAIKRARIQINAIKPTTTIPSLVKELETTTELINNLDKYVNRIPATAPKEQPKID